MLNDTTPIEIAAGPDDIRIETQGPPESAPAGVPPLTVVAADAAALCFDEACVPEGRS